jgi:hypothetical protein
MARPDHKASPGRKGLRVLKVPRAFPALKARRVLRGLPDPRVSRVGMALKGPLDRRGRPDLRDHPDHPDLPAQRLNPPRANPVCLARRVLKVPRGRPVRKARRVSLAIRVPKGPKEHPDRGASPAPAARLDLQARPDQWEPKGRLARPDPQALPGLRASPDPPEGSDRSVLQGLQGRSDLPD